MLGKQTSAMVSGHASVVGTKYGALNQDVSLVHRIPIPQTDKHIIIAAVLDGHGMLGEVAAEAAGRELVTHIVACIQEHVIAHNKLKKNKDQAGYLRAWGKRRIREMFDTAFQKAHACVLDIYQAAPPKYSFPDGTGMGHHVFELQSRDKRNDTAAIYTNPTAGARLVEFGTTASVVVLEPGFVAVGHVGDSDVILGSLDGQFLVATELTKPHSGHNISERYRIGEFLCEDEELLGLAALREDGYLEVSNLGGLSSVALGMTRAVGHYHLQAFGVIPSPEISFYDIDDGKDVCLILATDGVWDAMHPRDAVVFVSSSLASKRSSPDRESRVAMDLCKACVEMQIKAVGAADNTSAAVIFFSGESFMDAVIRHEVSDVRVVDKKDKEEESPHIPSYVI
ncbi:Putative protein phosphatase 2C 33 [Picochlorum sp. SENEW3]|nr:Putative protein phosphatase 2C 33 [Picochlorum sp. SENEW3]